MCHSLLCDRYLWHWNELSQNVNASHVRLIIHSHFHDKDCKGNRKWCKINTFSWQSGDGIAWSYTEGTAGDPDNSMCTAACFTKFERFSLWFWLRLFLFILYFLVWMWLTCFQYPGISFLAKSAYTFGLHTPMLCCNVYSMCERRGGLNSTYR